MQCGINPSESSIPSCSSTYRKSSSPLFGMVSTPTRITSRVCLGLNGKGRLNTWSRSDDRPITRIHLLYLCVQHHTLHGILQRNPPIHPRLFPPPPPPPPRRPPHPETVARHVHIHKAVALGRDHEAARARGRLVFRRVRLRALRALKGTSSDHGHAGTSSSTFMN